MRLVSRWSSVLAATALVGTSFTLAGPALAVDLPEGDPEVAVTEPAGEVAPDENPEEGSPGEEAPEQDAPAEEAPVQVPGTSDIAPQAVSANPTIAKVRAGADGETVTTEGWVTAAYPTGGLNGFVIQTAGSGGAYDLTTESDAIFVYTNHSDNVAPTPEVGKYVKVTGSVATFNGLRQLNIGPAANAPSKIEVVADTTGIAPATPATGAWPKTAEGRTAIQSMLYTPSSDAGFAVTDNYNANSYGTLGISVTGEPLRQPSDVTADTAKRAEIATANAANLFVLDDGATTRFAGGNATNNKLVPPYVDFNGNTRVGATVTFDHPLIVDYRNNAWTLNPTAPIETSATAVVSDLPATFSATRPGSISVTGDVVVGGFNLENYFPTQLGQAWANVCEPYTDNSGAPVTVKSCNNVTSGTVTTGGPRGAWNATMLAFQTDRLVKAINTLDAAALGVMELENSFKLTFGTAAKSGDSAKYLVNALNKASTSGKWAYIDPTPLRQQAVASQDVMYPGIIYQPAKVKPLINGQLTLTNQSGAGQPFANARAPFGQAFTPVGGGEPFFLVANHFKSKSSPGAGAEADLGEGGWNASRTAQAKALADWVNGPALNTLATNTGVAVKDVVLVGDFNAYTYETPMTTLYNAGFTNVNIDPVTGEPRQASYSYSGLNGSLDHVLVSKSIVASQRNQGSAIWNINAPEQIGLHYSRYNNTGGDFVQQMEGTYYRGSDHDPAIVGLKSGKTTDTKDVSIFNINDFHGRIDGTLNSNQNGLNTSNVGTYDTMQFVYTLEALREQMGEANTVFLSAGDNVGASLFASSLQADQPTIDLLNKLGLGVTAVGNHEFDQGYEDLTGRLASKFDGPLIAANVYVDETGKSLLPRYAFVEANGLKIAVTGAVTQETPTLVSPNNVAGLTFKDPVDSVNEVVAELEKLPAGEKPDLIVAEYHEGAATGVPAGTLEQQVKDVPVFAKIVNETSPAVDVIFNGHTHQVYAWDGPVPGSTDGKTRPIVSTGSYGANIGQVTLTVNDTGDVESYLAVNVPTAGTAASPGFAAGVPMETMQNFNATSKDAYKIIVDALKVATAEGSKPAAKLTAPISRAYTEGTYENGVWVKTEKSGEDRGGASPLGTIVGNMLLDGQLSQIANKPDFGVTNPGGLRTDLIPDKDGVITVAQARSVLPFNNELATVKMTGAQIVTMLEQQWQRTATGAVPSRSYLQLGLSDNFQYTFHQVDDPAHPGYKLGVIDSVTLNGEPLDLEKTYTAGTMTFLAAGGDNFHVFAKGEVNSSYGLLDWESWLGYLATESGLEDGKFSSAIEPNWARQGVEVVLPEDGLVSGATAKITYKNANIHAIGAPANTKVTVKAGTETLGSADVVNAQQGTSWSDSTTVSITVPGSGDLDLQASFDPTKTTANSAVQATERQLEIRRLGGSTRYGTNLAVNDALDHEKGGVVFVATGLDFADALSVAPAAAVSDGALFLTPAGAMPADTLAKIKNLEPSKVYVVGGPGVVSSNVVAQLRNATNVFPLRIYGETRYETSAKVFQTFFNGRDVDRAFIATGLSYPDGLSASAAAGAFDAPVLLVNGSSGSNLMSESTALLKRLGAETIVIAGGPGAVNTKIESNLKKNFSTVTRVSGADRYATNIAVNNYVSANVGDTAMTGVWVATGLDFPDALSAAPAAGDPTQRLVLTNGKCIPKPVVSEWIDGSGSRVGTVTLVGGSGVLSDALMKLPECK